MSRRTLYGTVIVTYRYNAHCNMCDCFRDPTKPEEEITLDVIRKLPEMAFTNITGGEPFIRKDLPEIVRELYKKSDRIVISTNGYFTERILALCEEFPEVGVRISIEGLQETNDEIRGIPDGFNRGYTTLKKLVEEKHPDVGFGMTVQDRNCEDLLALYNIANDMGMESLVAYVIVFQSMGKEKGNNSAFLFLIGLDDLEDMRDESSINYVIAHIDKQTTGFSLRFGGEKESLLNQLCSD